MASMKEIAKEIPNVIRLYKDFSVERFNESPFVPPSLDEDPQSKDITIAGKPYIVARLYLPKPSQPAAKFPILVYFRGGGFCKESAFSSLVHNYVKSLALESQVLVVSIEYRQAPENPLPAAYEDCWDGLQWVASHSFKKEGDPWILDHGDFGRFFIGGDSAGANIVHYLALRVGSENLEGDVRILGAYLGYPLFWGSKPIGNEKIENHHKAFACLLWDFAYPDAPYGIDNPLMNPGSSAVEPNALSKLGCSRMLVYVGGKDELRDRGVWYVDLVNKSGWNGEIVLLEYEGERHGFHALNPQTHHARDLMKQLILFLNK